MKLILLLAFRNLLRQKRRSVFLGSAVAFGMMILVMANSFAHGISDNILNRMIVYMVGHVEISMMEQSKQYHRVIRDRERFEKVIRENTDNVKEINESIGIFTRIVGIGKSDNAIMVGLIDNEENRSYFTSTLIDGAVDDFFSGTIENPVVVYEDKAKLLNVKVHDTLRAKLKTVSGQEQSARFTVAAIIKPANIFESFAIFVNLGSLKTLINMKPWETGALQIVFNKVEDPRIAIRQADRIHGALTPGTAFIAAKIKAGGADTPVTLLGYASDDTGLESTRKALALTAGKLPDAKAENKLVLPEALAKKLKLAPGDKATLRYPAKYGNRTVELECTAGALYRPGGNRPPDLAFLNELSFYKLYHENLPAPAERAITLPDKSDTLAGLLAPEWRLLPRTPDHDTMEKKLAEMTRSRWKGPSLDVRTMYESASQVLDLEYALNLITFLAVLILFFIILIGVVNTLRMTIRERTREIGTVRAIGMQSGDVRALFMAETVFLSAIASAAGIVLGFVFMGIMGLFTIETESVLSILLVERHLYFLPTVLSITGNFLLILAITALTAYFPAKRAARLSAADALRHFE
ncbi:MAG: FtsX-like permease family protein [Spirochaetes bacterium]|nr:MAG: FtsX-like permease family protein [Spirochaetota bacterium]